MAEKKTVITVDPSMQYSRMLHYREKHSGGEIYKAVYWGIYFFILGLLLLSQGTALSLLTGFFGWALLIFSLFVIVFGFAAALHLKLMKKYA